MQSTSVPQRRIGSPREIVRWANEEGVHVSEVSVRRWLKEDKIRHVYSGKKALIPYEPFLEFLGVSSTPRS